MAERDALQTLRDALVAAKEKLRQQGEALKRLTAEPLRFATVVAIKEPEPLPPPSEKAAPKPAPWQELTLDTRVVVLDGQYKGRTGEITQETNGNGYVEVRFDDGGRCFFYADPTKRSYQPNIKVEAADGPPRILKEGDEIRVVEDRGSDSAVGTRGRIERVLVETDGADSWVRVKFPKRLGSGTTRDFHYFPPPVLALKDEAAHEALAEAPRHGTATVLFDGKEVEVVLPTDRPVVVGDTVKLSMQSLQIVDVVSTLLAGEVVGVQKVLDAASSEVDFQGGTRAVYNGRFSGQLKDGDRVVLDPSGLVIIRNLGQEDKKDTLFAFTEKTGVTWDMIGGLDEAKRQMVEAIELPYRYGEYYRFYGKKPLKGLLLYGPPGCGKTMLGKAAATALASLHEGKGADTCFMYVKAPEILNKFVGASEATVRRMFAAARAHRDAHGYPAVIFLDEADAILGRRGSGISSDIERTIVPMFLAEMDGFEDTGAVVILATNRADTLDPAVVRDGRIDRKILVARPTPEAATAIFGLHLGKVPLRNGYTHRDLAARATEELFSPAHALYEVRLKDGGTKCFTFGHLASGALIAGIVDQATSVALARDIADGAPQGLTPADIDDAVARAFAQARDLNHDDDLRAFAEGFTRDVTHIDRTRGPVFVAAGGGVQ